MFDILVIIYFSRQSAACIIKGTDIKNYEWVSTHLLRRMKKEMFKLKLK